MTAPLINQPVFVTFTDGEGKPIYVEPSKVESVRSLDVGTEMVMGSGDRVRVQEDADEAFYKLSAASKFRTEVVLDSLVMAITKEVRRDTKKSYEEN